MINDDMSKKKSPHFWEKYLVLSYLKILPMARNASVSKRSHSVGSKSLNRCLKIALLHGTLRQEYSVQLSRCQPKFVNSREKLAVLDVQKMKL